MYRKKFLLVLLVTFLLNSCLYIPTPDHGGDSAVSDEILITFVPGETTLADVILKLGKPVQRLEEDRYLIYHWEAIVGYMIFAYGYSGIAGLNSELNYLCFEFSSDNILKRYKHFDQGILGRFRKHPESDIMEWMRD